MRMRVVERFGGRARNAVPGEIDGRYRATLRFLRTTGNHVMTAHAPGADTMSDMGVLYTTVLIENPLRRGDLRALPETLVDTGAELTWAPRAVMEELGIQVEKRETFQMADGRAITRDVGYAIVHAAGARTNDEVVFAEPDDLILLGARSLEGMNLRVDSRNKQLVAAGPIVAAAG